MPRTGRPKAALALNEDERDQLERWSGRAKSVTWSASISITPSVRWCPRFHMHFTPTSSSWLNQVERWFGLLTDKKLRRGVHKSVPALEHDIREWIKNWNEEPRPFAWTKTADEILERLASHIQRIPGGGH